VVHGRHREQQLWLNRLTSTASYQAFIGQIMSPICRPCGTGEETAEHLLLFCPDWAAERQWYFGDSIDITDVFQDSDNGVEFLISSKHLTALPHPYRCRWLARRDNNSLDISNIWHSLCLGHPVSMQAVLWQMSSPPIPLRINQLSTSIHLFTYLLIISRYLLTLSILCL